MASSSSLTTHKSYMYDVFLSFRGEDTRKNFVDHLYAALQRQGIHTYKDDERLEKGRRINDELLKSIEQSKFYIVIFSKNYASSSWCMDELVKIMECKKSTEQIVYPVFYDVDPSEIRKQLGVAGEAFSRHNKPEVGKWKDALDEATNLVGWDLRNTADGHEAKVIDMIVEKILLELCFITVEVDEKLVGMESRIKDIVSYLEIDGEDVCMIGIKGIGGGGKTTLARAVFDKICFSFEGKSFVENIREFSNSLLSGLRLLQRQVLSDLLNDKQITIKSVHDGKTIMKKMLCGKKVLLVLDDVDHLDQLDALAGSLDWFKPGSRIIITTRDEQVLVAHRVKWIYDLSLLSHKEAICLFSRYAFDRDNPIQRYKDLSLEVVRYASGLPLTIKVLGSFLCGQNELEWEDALERLKTIPLKETLEKLELSYTGLEDDYKEIFLDVACLMKGWNKEDAIRALESCGFHARNGLRVLEQKSLITISCGQLLGMHDHIEEMGRNIVRRARPDEPIGHSRLWILSEIEDVLADDLVTEATRAIVIKTWLREGNRDSKIFTKGFGNMKRLRFLHMSSNGHASFPETEVGCRKFPNSLRFLNWEGYPHCFLPKTFQANNLVSLVMPNSRIEQLWEEGERKVLKNLRFLDLRDSDLTTLDCGLLPKLEKLILQSCYYLAEPHVPTGCLRRLVYLDLRHCFGLKSLLFIKRLESLQVLDLSSSGMKEFPDIFTKHSNYSLLELKLSGNDFTELPSSIANLQKLVSLNLSRCENLKSLPQSISSLHRLKDFHLNDCCAIEDLPKDFGRLECLETLDLRYTRVKHLPNSICMLKHLKTLLLANCKALTKLPKNLGRLESLEELSLACCYSIKYVPCSICKLKKLQKLDLFLCPQIQRLPKRLANLESLMELDVRRTGISYLPQSIFLLEGLKLDT